MIENRSIAELAHMIPTLKRIAGEIPVKHQLPLLGELGARR